MDNQLSSQGVFYVGDPVDRDYYKVDILTRRWGEGFLTELYVRQFDEGREVLVAPKLDFPTFDPTEAHNIHFEIERQIVARELGRGSFIDRGHIETGQEFSALEITVDRDSKSRHSEPQRPVIRANTTASNNDLPENLLNNSTDTDPSPTATARVLQSEAEQTQAEGEDGLDWATVAQSAGKSFAMGAGMALLGAGAVAVGVTSLPILAGVGLGAGIISLFQNANAARDAGADASFSKVFAGTISRMMPIDLIGVGEVIRNRDYIADKEMTPQERSEKLGSTIGGSLVQGATMGVARYTRPQTSRRRAFVRDVAKNFKQIHQDTKRAEPNATSWEVSIKAHTWTQERIAKKHGKSVVAEPVLGVSHQGTKPTKPGRFNEGARADIANNDLKTISELKANITFKNGRIEVNKRIDGKWLSTYTNQIKSLEILARTHSDWSVTIITSKGRIFEFRPKADRWVEIR